MSDQLTGVSSDSDQLAGLSSETDQLPGMSNDLEALQFGKKYTEGSTVSGTTTTVCSLAFQFCSV